MGVAAVKLTDKYLTSKGEFDLKAYIHDLKEFTKCKRDVSKLDYQQLIDTKVEYLTFQNVEKMHASRLREMYKQNTGKKLPIRLRVQLALDTMAEMLNRIGDDMLILKTYLDEKDEFLEDQQRQLRDDVRAFVQSTDDLLAVNNAYNLYC